MHRRLITTAVAISLVLAACSTEPGARVAGPPSFAGSAGARAVMPNGVAYGHGGIRPATGRSGAAAVLAQAAFAGTGTVVTVRSYRGDDPSFATPAGTIEKLQLKAYGADGRLAWTRNYKFTTASSTRVLTVTDLAAGMRLQVQATVQDLDPRRADVVTVATVVVARPANVRLGPVQAESRWYLGAPLMVTALVTETGGDLDVTFACALYVDGAPAERIANVLVLAGDQVNCNFTHTFGAIGTHELRVALEGMTPGDANPLDNQLVLPVDVYAPEGALLPVFNYSSEVQDITLATFDSTRTTVRDVNSGAVLTDNAYVQAAAGRDQVSQFNGIFASRIAFPLARLVLSQRSGATLIHADTLTDLPQNGVGTVPCTVGSAADGVSFSLCAFPNGLSMLYYARQAGTVAYRTQSYNLLVDPSLCTDGDGCWVMMETQASGTPAVWGSSLSYDVSVTAGDTVLAAAPTIALGIVNEHTAYGPACATVLRTDSVPGPFGIIITLHREVTTCATGTTDRTGLAGSGSGVGVTELAPVP